MITKMNFHPQIGKLTIEQDDYAPLMLESTPVAMEQMLDPIGMTVAMLTSTILKLHERVSALERTSKDFPI
jgi:hypothetical protein